jgi:hypothetical protein
VVHVTAFCRHAVLPIVLNDVPAPVQQRYLAHSPVEVMAEYPIQTVIQLSKTKKKPVHQNQPQQNFRSAEASLMYRPCISQAPKRMCYMCDSVGPLTWEYSLPHRTDVCQWHIGGFYRLLWKNAALYGIL